MDKEHKLLNALLDEIDGLDAQLQEALDEFDYELAHLLQEALLFKQHYLYQWEKVFIPVQGKRWTPSYKFVVSNAPNQSVLKEHLRALLQKDVNILALQVRFKRQYSGKNIERLSIYRNPLTQEIILVLTKPDLLFFQGAVLKHIGWERDEENAQRFLYTLRINKKNILQHLELIIARTFFEVIDKYKIKTELAIIR